MQSPSAEIVDAPAAGNDEIQFRHIPVPPQRYTRLKARWDKIYTPIHKKMKIDIQTDLDWGRVELRTRPDTPDARNLQRCADFVRAYLLGFDLIDAETMLWMDELHVETFELRNVKTLLGEPLAQSIERLGRNWCDPRIPIENLTGTKIVIENSRIYVLGDAAEDIEAAREAIAALVTVLPAAFNVKYSTLGGVIAGLSKRRFHQDQARTQRINDKKVSSSF